MPDPTAAKIALVSLLALAALAGCSARPTRRVPTAATTAPSIVRPAVTAPTIFSRPDLGVRLAPPVGWVARPSADYVLLLHPAGSGNREPPSLSLDVPDLPFHIPGMIPIAAVRSGYLDDLRKEIGPLTTDDLPPPDVGGATARLVRSRWQRAPGDAAEETALLMVHADRVYILRGRADASHASETRAAFDSVVSSVRWIKPGVE